MNKQNIEIPFRSSNIKKLNNRKNLIIEIDQKELELKYCVNVKLIFNLSGMNVCTICTKSYFTTEILSKSRNYI